MSDIALFPSLDMMDRITLNSLEGTNTLSTVSLTLSQVNPIGLVTLRPSIETEMIVDDTSLRSSLTLPNCFRLFVRARSNDSFSIRLIIISISCIVIGTSELDLLYCDVIESEMNDRDGKLMIISSGGVEIDTLAWSIACSILWAIDHMSATSPLIQFFRLCLILENQIQESFHSATSYTPTLTR